MFKDVRFACCVVGTPVKKDSWEECSERCDNEPKCFAWSYKTEQFYYAPHHKYCYMKDASFKAGKRRMLGVISGCSKSKELYFTEQYA